MMKNFENMFEGYEWKSFEYRNMLEMKGFVNEENKELLDEIIDEFFTMEQMYLQQKFFKEKTEEMRDTMIKVRDENIEWLSNKVKELQAELDKSQVEIYELQEELADAEERASDE